MTINDLITQLHKAPDSIQFTDVMQVISQSYSFAPTSFSNGTLQNSKGSNEGSCKIFYFARLHKFTEAETLSLFGSYYRDDVLTNPTGTDHGNIRNFMLTGSQGINFDSPALTNLAKQTQ